MALEFTDFGLTPDDVVREREKALSSFANVTGPAAQKKIAAERGRLITDMSTKIAKAAREGQAGAMSGALGEAVVGASELLPQQRMERDAVARQGADMRAGVSIARQTAAVNKYDRDTSERKAIAAKHIANQAFNMGYSAKELALHRSGYLADEGLKQMYYDYQQGRLSREEVFDLQAKFMKEAQAYEIETQKKLAELKSELAIALKENDVNRAKTRLLEVFKIQQKAARDAAEASAFGAMLSGAFKIIGTVAIAAAMA